ncbi:MAG: hypothetical protein JWP02_3668 [Acidimicrobiales bacterium]|nr:hypothetical protein [Acidimicrobiales bacterium]
MKHLGFEVSEVMDGSLRRQGENFDREFRFDLGVVFPALWRIFGIAVGRASGTAHVDGLARGATATGTLELSPFRRRLARYTFTFTADDGNEYRFDGSKRAGLNARRAWTTLPGHVYDANGDVWATATLRFSFRRHFPGLLRSFRFLWPWRGAEREPQRGSRPAVHV